MAHSTTNGAGVNGTHTNGTTGAKDEAAAAVAANIAAAMDAHDPPLPQHLNIVALETYYTPLPPLIVPKPYTFTLTEYQRTAPDQIAERIKDADILITTIVPIRGKLLDPAVSPKLRMIAVMASGVDSVDLGACKARGIRVLNSPNCNSISVAEHVVALYLALRRSLFTITNALGRGDWSDMGKLMTKAYQAGVPPRSCADELVGIVGYGGVGQHSARLLGALGMKVVIAGRRGDPPKEGRVPFEEVLRTASVLVVCCPRVPETEGLIGDAELAQMQPDALVINVARGGIVGEEALAAAVREGRIAGGAADVFDHEPATPESSPLIRAATKEDLNLIVSGHTSWVSGSTRANYQRVVQENVEEFIRGKTDPTRTKA